MATDRNGKVSMDPGIMGIPLSPAIRHFRRSIQVSAILQIVHFELSASTLLLPFISFVRVTLVIQLFVDLFLKLFVLLVLFSPF